MLGEIGSLDETLVAVWTDERFLAIVGSLKSSALTKITST
jgi:hypothetical protein